MNKSRYLFRNLLASAACALLLSVSAWGQVQITTTGTPATENFNTIGNGATATLPSGWRVDSATQTTVYSSATTVTTRSAGTTGTGALNGTSSGGTYNFANGDNTTSTDRAVGFLTSGSYLSPRNLFVQLTNNTGGTIDTLTISFDIEKYRSGARAYNLNFFSSTDGTNWTTQADGTVAYPADAANTTIFNPPVATSRTVTLNSLNLAPGASFYLRWQYAGNGGSTNGQGLGLDNFSVTAQGGPAVPTIVTTGTLSDFGSVPVGTTSAEQNYRVSASGLSGNLTVTAPGDFQLSTTSGANFASSLVLTPSNGTVTSTTIYVRFAPATPGTQSGNITHESAGATTQNVAVAGTGVNSYTISGRLLNTGGVGLSGLTVTLSGGASTVSTTTDANGNYSFANVIAGGDYAVTPAATSFTFAPVSQAFDALAANQTADFTGTPRVIISEFRLRGTDPDGAGALTAATNEFFELYNQTDTAVTMSGWALASSDGALNLTLPNNTVVPARGHYLVAGTSYGLSGYAAPDATLPTGTDIADNAGLALFNSTATRTAGTRLDAVGFGTSADLYREGAGLSPTNGINLDGEYSFVRKVALTTAFPQDTNSNPADFAFVSTDGGNYGIQSQLGAPGPESIASPTQNALIAVAPLDPAVSPSVAPNRVRDLNAVPNGAQGTFEYRKTYTNNTTANVTRLRFRITDITSYPAPNSTTADWRALNSSDVQVTLSNNSTVTVRGTRVEEPPTQGLGGALNTTFVADAISAQTPLAPGQSVSVRFVLGQQQGGRSRFATNVETTLAAVPGTETSEHLVMGNPSNAVTDVNTPLNYLLVKPEYALSYHRDRGTMNWTSWHLDSSWLGSTPRQNDFREDPTLPSGFYHVQGTDYTGSGFDRGHMTPSGDRTSSVPVNSATFLMTNILPQAPDNNQGPWEQLESYCRTLVGQGNELYIISGPAGTGGTGSNGGVTTTITNGHVTVPAQTWKVIIVLPVGTNDVARVTTSTRTIAVIMPNTQGIRTNTWQQYRVSVDQVEALTGFDFFSNVAPGIQAVIEATVDNQ